MSLQVCVEMAHAEDVLAGLAKLREDNILCDVELQVDGRSVSAHRVVLAASSSYFRSMFAGRFEEATSQVVNFKQITFTGLSKVVDFVYTSRVDLTNENIEDVLPSAHLLQMNSIVDKCKEWMIQKVTSTNCLAFLKLAEKFNLETTEAAITKFVLENFVSISKTEAFSNISKQGLVKYLSSDTLRTKFNESVAYKAVKNWILKNNVEDKMEVCEILKNIRFALITPENLSDEILQDAMIVENKECLSMVGEAMKYHGNVYTQPFYKGNLNKPRGEAGVLMITNPDKGEGYNVPNGRLYGGIVDWLSFPEFDCQCCDDPPFGKVVYESILALQVNNFLFVFGTKCDGYQNFSTRYDATNDKWLELAAVPRQATIGSSLACTFDQRNIFLFGGMHVNKDSEYGIDGAEIINAVFNYDVPSNSWRQGKDIPSKLVHSASASLQNIMYVTGGYVPYSEDYESDFFSTNEVWAYDVSGKIWLSKSHMHNERSRHVLEASNDKLWAIGGMMLTLFTTSVEVFDPLLNQWTVISPDIPALCDASSIVVGHEIYVVGGVHESEDAADVFVYDTNQNKLTTVLEKIGSDCSRNISALMSLGVLVQF